MKTQQMDSASRIPNNLPPRPEFFVDREYEIHQATDQLLHTRTSVVALIGMAGIGKTWLALEIAYRLLGRDEFEGGVAWLYCRDLQSPGDLTRKLGTALGAPETKVHHHLSSQRCFIVLDGLEESPPRLLPEVDRFLDQLPAPSQSLITGRDRSLLPSRSTALLLAAFGKEVATEFFTALVARQGVQVSAEDQQRFDEFVGALGYHPLALTLAASALRGGDYASTHKIIQQLLDVAPTSLTEQQRAAMLYDEQALAITRQIGDKHALSSILFGLGTMYVEQSRWYDGLRLLEESLTIRRQDDDLDTRADAIYQIARTHHLMGNLDKARIHYRDALRLYEHTGNQSGIAACKTGLGRLEIQMGFLSDASRELEQAKHIYAAMGKTQSASEVEGILQLANQIRERGGPYE